MTLLNSDTDEIKENATGIKLSGKIIARNTSYNLIGYVLPLIVAVVFIPPLIDGLGQEKFGILNLAWIIIGYFSFFDFGIGRTLTKIIAEKIGLNQVEQIPKIFWTSFSFMLAASLFLAIIFIIGAPYLVNNFFKISSEFRPESLYSFYALAAAIPLVATTAGLRGVLEAYQQFGIVNLIRIILGFSTFLGPLICLMFSDNLFWIILVLILVRVIVWALYLYYCFKVNENIKRKFQYDFKFITPLLKITFWITVANIIGPLIIYSDRFLIGSIISAATIPFYAVPFELVTKFLIIPTALSGVLFPIVSGTFLNNPDFSQKLFNKGVKFIFLFLFPVVLLTVTFSFEGLGLWLGKKYAESSSFILQVLSIGILLNSLSYIPFNFFQGIGKSYIPAVLYLVEFPFYLFIMWISIEKYGINGAAVVWLLRVVVDTAVLFFLSEKFIRVHFKNKSEILFFLLLMVFLIFPFMLNTPFLKAVYIIVTLSMYLIITWKIFLLNEEKLLIIAKVRSFRTLLSFLK